MAKDYLLCFEEVCTENSLKNMFKHKIYLDCGKKISSESSNEFSLLRPSLEFLHMASRWTLYRSLFITDPSGVDGEGKTYMLVPPEW